ncbi:unnamed protein product [Amoebophrya sp. A25]|nr:unnamed protein product [Amoebophrya sp. A25]|eukprot:GSA25T00015368001.1
MYSSLLYPRTRVCPRITFKRIRVVKGQVVQVPLGNFEDMEFLVAPIYDDKTILVGVFVFPRCYLVKWGICAENFSGGQTAMTLYPPEMKKLAFQWSSKREQAEEQRKFYIDLRHTSAGEGMPESDKAATSGKTDTGTANAKSMDNIEKFGRIILGSYGECSAPPPSASADVIEDGN